MLSDSLPVPNTICNSVLRPVPSLNYARLRTDEFGIVN
jgi:hypothetical protein